MIESQACLEVKIPGARVPVIQTFRYVECPLLGVGREGQPFVYFDDWIDPRKVDAAFEEFTAHDTVIRNNSKLLTPNGIVPAKINGGSKSVDSVIANFEKYLDPETLSAVTRAEHLSHLKKVVADRLGQRSNWDLFIHLRSFSTFERKSDPSQWLPFTQELPAMRALIESLPFERIGYAVIFVSNPGTPILIHRDTFPRKHSSQFININLDRKPREFFLYDPKTGKRHYREPGKFSYLFNECDFHGANSDPNRRVTLRVQGELKTSVLDSMGARDGLVFDWNFERSQDVILRDILVEQNTDV